MTEETVAAEDKAEEVKAIMREDLTDELGIRMLAQLDEYAEQAENASAVIKASKTDDIAGLVVQYREGSPRYDEYQTLISQAEEILAEIDKNNESKVEKPTEDQVKQAEVTLAAMRDQGKHGIIFLVGAYGEGARALLPEALATRKGGSVSTGTIKRPRMQTIIVNDVDGNELVTLNDLGEDAKPEDKPTFSALATWLTKDSGVKPEEFTKALQNAAFAEAKTKDLSTVPKVEFGQTLGDKHYSIVAVSKTK